MIDNQSLSGASVLLQNFIKKDKILKNCIPVNLEKIEARAEIGYYKLIGVNNNIEAMDYGKAVYDDMPSLKRNKININDQPDYQPDEVEI